MSLKHKPASYHGLLLIDKPKGITSHDVVARLRHLLQQKQIGHTGTLDPMATGLMILLLGQATKLADQLSPGAKTYEAEIELGYTTKTLDAESEILETFETNHLEKAEIQSACDELVGELTLKVPTYSAVKVNGQKLMDKARKDQEVIRPERSMVFDSCWVQKIDLENKKVHVLLTCKKGGYIRSWSEALGEKLNCGATLVGLRRTHNSKEDLKDAIALYELEDHWAEHKPELAQKSYYKPIHDLLPELSRFYVGGKDQKLIQNGQISHSLSRRFTPLIRESKKQGQVVRVLSPDSQLLSLIHIYPEQKPQILRVF